MPVRLASALLSTLSLLAFGGDEEAAAERYKQASNAKEAAATALEQSYLRCESAWTGWRAAESPRTPPLLDLLAEKCSTLAVNRAKQRPPNETATPKEARAQKRAEIDATAALVTAVLAERGLTEVSLAGPLSEIVAREAAGRTNVEETRTRLAPFVATWVGSTQKFETLWNDALFTRVPEVNAWRECYDEYLAAGAELDRARHPESYLPGGAKARPGMVYVAGGSYTVGPNHGFERKKRKVSIRPFLIDRCEVSNADYVTFLESLPADQRTAHTPRHWEVGADGKPQPRPDELDRPVAGVTWRDANAYALFVGKRLPTEDEWEIAARGKEGFAFPWGNDYADGRCNDSKLNLGATVAVGRFPEGSAPCKALNLAGNVEEWTASLEEGDTITDLPSNIAAVIVRGGHFLSPPESVGGLFRWVAPGGSSRELFLGFRCVADLQ